MVSSVIEIRSTWTNDLATIGERATPLTVKLEQVARKQTPISVQDRSWDWVKLEQAVRPTMMVSPTRTSDMTGET
jgi:hypothetical protein